jgi:alpha-amylase
MPGWQAPTWHRNPHRDEYYYGLFWSGMPDLNLANPEVKAFAEDVSRYWLEEMGVGGFRLDAVSHFFEDGGEWRHVPGRTSGCGSTPAMVKGIDPTAFTVGEVFDDLDATLAYYPDQLDTYFMFELADAIVESANTASKERVVAVMNRIQDRLPQGRWSTFLRNHDQNRTMTDLGGSYDRARVAASLLLTLPGTPFVYYGEEIGMTGSKRMATRGCGRPCTGSGRPTWGSARCGRGSRSDPTPSPPTWR